MMKLLYNKDNVIFNHLAPMNIELMDRMFFLNGSEGIDEELIKIRGCNLYSCII
jgi:hypothetical protein